MSDREKNGDQLEGWSWEAVWICESDSGQNENVVGDSVNDIAVPVTAALF
jgi:hypothetical protein